MQYTNPTHVQFVQDMKAAGFEVEYYEGRNYWKGPAVRHESYAEVMAKTSVIGVKYL